MWYVDISSHDFSQNSQKSAYISKINQFWQLVTSMEHEKYAFWGEPFWFPRTRGWLFRIIVVYFSTYMNRQYPNVFYACMGQTLSYFMFFLVRVFFSPCFDLWYHDDIVTTFIFRQTLRCWIMALRYFVPWRKEKVLRKGKRKSRMQQQQKQQ